MNFVKVIASGHVRHVSQGSHVRHASQGSHMRHVSQGSHVRHGSHVHVSVGTADVNFPTHSIHARKRSTILHQRSGILPTFCKIMLRH